MGSDRLAELREASFAQKAQASLRTPKSLARYATVSMNTSTCLVNPSSDAEHVIEVANQILPG
jgi:hypothetical protein